jgi:hypothetical protein
VDSHESLKEGTATWHRQFIISRNSSCTNIASKLQKSKEIGSRIWNRLKYRYGQYMFSTGKRNRGKLWHMVTMRIKI